MIRLKWAYDPASKDDGVRILVDRFWPRGVEKHEAHIREWRKELAPTDALRRWFHHDPEKWEEFRERYRNELRFAGRLEEVYAIGERARRETVTLVFAARDRERNNAAVLKELMENPVEAWAEGPAEDSAGEAHPARPRRAERPGERRKRAS